ncbi:MAG: type II toxin-antitoxin system RelE/ParE family toxin [Reyranella sp.]
MKPVVFRGDSLERLRRFPASVRQDAGYQLERLQRGTTPDDFKPMSTIGAGVQEIRVRDAAGAFRVIYVARFEEAVYVLHAFQKKTAKTAPLDIELARQRYRRLLEDRK